MKSRVVRRLLGSRALLVALVGASAVAGVAFALADSDVGQAQQSQSDVGASLYIDQCAACHGVGGQGIEDRGPSLEDEGAASVDFVLRTGRMPLASPTMQATRGPVRYTDDEIRALVDHVGRLGNGADIPDVDPLRGDVSKGGELYRLNCAACHVASGSGAPIGGGYRAPNLLHSTPTEVGEAILVGPGSMPVFGSFTEHDIDSVAAYIEELEAENTTGASSFGGAGPVAEGLSAWLLALIPLIALTRWIGSPKAGRDSSVDGTDNVDVDVDESGTGIDSAAGDTDGQEARA